jgi:hypothetical protein
MATRNSKGHYVTNVDPTSIRQDTMIAVEHCTHRVSPESHRLISWLRSGSPNPV